MMEAKEAAREGGRDEVAAAHALARCYRWGKGEDWRGGGAGGRDRANCFNKAAAERRTVVESGN